MARPSRPWFRFYVEAVTDRKLRRLTPAQRWLWVAILAAARQSPKPGVLLVADDLTMTVEELADHAGMRVRDVKAGLEQMLALGLVAITDGLISVPRWDDRQFESDDVTARTAKHRSRERSQERSPPVPGNAPETEAETEAESEPKRSRRKPEREVPDDWTPSQKTRDWANTEYPQHANRRVLASFIDNARKKDLRFRDIEAAFRNWIRQEEKYHPTTGGSEPARTFL